MTGPCKGCQDRHPACHDMCEKYKAWKTERDAAMAWLREQNQQVSDSVFKRNFSNIRQRARGQLKKSGGRCSG